MPEAAGLWLIGAARQSFAGSAAFLDDPANRAELSAYLADLVRPYPATGGTVDDQPGGRSDGDQPDASTGGHFSGDQPGPSGGGHFSADQPGASAGGHSYGEMAEALIRTLAPDEPVDLLVLAYAVHDVQPGRATATYLSSVCPGTPLSFAVSDQGSAAAFTGLRIARTYLAGAAVPVGSSGAVAASGAGATSGVVADPGRRALLIVAEQAALPYPSAAARPARHRGLALLLSSGTNESSATGDAGGSSGTDVPAGATGRLVGLRQRPDTAPDALADRVTADLAELSDGYRRVRVVAGAPLASAWPDRPAGLRTGPVDQPSTGVWWQLLDELAGAGSGHDRPDLLVVADYDPELGYLCLAAFEPA